MWKHLRNMKKKRTDEENMEIFFIVAITIVAVSIITAMIQLAFRV